MATDLLTRKPASRAATSLQRKFAALCARIRRTDLIADLLVLSLVVLSYALFAGMLDWYSGHSTTIAVEVIRWACMAAFAGLFAFCLVQTVRCWFRPVNPYFVARQIEATLPNAKNSLINWLDLHDEELPGAFQRNLSLRAEEQMNHADADETVRSRKNWYLLGILAAPALGLLVLLIVDPPGLGGSLMRAFAPFHAPATGPRTHITLVTPANGNADVDPGLPVSFTALIEGRFPVGDRPGAPRLHFRYQPSEAYRSLPLRSDDGATWMAELLPGQIRTGLTYKISAGDAETPVYQIRARAPVHVVRYEITYRHRGYRKLASATEVFPNSAAIQPIIHGPPGTDVEMVVRTSQPVKQARVELAPQPGAGEPILRIMPGEPNRFACRWTLIQAGRFRVLFTTAQGEENTDRDWHDIHVAPDGAPHVILTRPEKNVTLPENGTLEVEGAATSDVGINSLALQLRIANGAERTALPPILFRPGKSFQQTNGGFPRVLEYLDVVPLDQLKDSKGTIRLFPPGTVIEYWLEATDCTDVPVSTGNVGRSDIHTITLAARIDQKTQQSQRQQATRKQKQHQQRQDSEQKKKNQPGNAGGQADPRKEFDAANHERQNVEPKIDQALKQKAQQVQRGGAKSGEPQNADAKPGPPPGSDQAQKKPAPNAPDQAGNGKDQGDKKPGGQAKDSGTKQKPTPKKGASSGASKDQPKGAGSNTRDAGLKGESQPGGNAKGAGQPGSAGPMPGSTKNQTSTPDAPLATAKKEMKTADGPDGAPQGLAKGIEQQGPATLNKDRKNAGNPPIASAKGGTKNDAGAPKTAKKPNAGNPRRDETKPVPQPPSLSEVAKWIEQLPQRGPQADAAGAQLADLARNTPDSALRDLVKDALGKHGRDPKTGKETRKGPSPIGFTGKSKGISDDVTAAAVNRDFAARLGQMQLAEWKKRLTPDLLKRAGLSDADWQHYLRTMKSYDALVRRLNAKLIRDEQLKELRGQAGAFPQTGPRVVEGANRSDTPFGEGGGVPPPELIDPNRRFEP
ncbi:MAG: hypothetical protein HYX68_12525 [Planctomycetes bacterium]|nr:hypothetical protein [Planctomycetota bacterium]